MIPISKGIFLLASLLLLGGCTGGSSDSMKKKTSEITNTSSENSVSKSDQSSESSKKAEDSSVTPENGLTLDQVMDAVKNQLETQVVIRLPTSIPLSNPNLHVSVATVSDATSYHVIFFESKEPIPINNNALNDPNQASQIVTISALRYPSVSEANVAVGYQKADAGYENGVGGIDLGHGLTGYENAGAGSQFIGWNEGNWYLDVRSSLANTTQPGRQIATKIVEKLEKELLPAPNSVGKIQADVTDNKPNQTSIVWQEEDSVYTIESSIDVLSTIGIATSFDDGATD
ncbi:hypothetical protein [Carnobacterium maltaromaticum]|uniref:hypothetical protein n=1 Tax=Carnobacterium maltaromaticum TaxID=2751 RepID=UPI00295E2429|nr:hypothetical protein [Carnobacterium maltaromaticum]